LVFLLFVRAVDLQRPRDWALYVVVAAIMVYVQMLSGLLLVAQFASLPLLAPTEKQRRQAIRSLLALVVLCLPLAAFVLLRNKGQADWIPATTLDEIRSIPRDMTGNYGVEFVYGVLFLVALANLVKEVRSARRDREVWIRGLVLLWVVVPAVLLIAISFVKPLLRTPYLIGILPGLTVLAGATIVDLSRRTVAIALTALLALFTVANVVTRDNPPPKVENLRDAATIVNERGEPGDGLAYMPAWSRVGFSYYLDRLKGSHSPSFVDASIAKGGTPVEQGDVLAREASPATVRKRMMSRRRIWLIWYRGVAGGWHPGPDPVSTVAPALLRKDFVRVGSWRFGQIRVNLFRNRSGPVYH
jgi:hypothetical protein